MKISLLAILLMVLWQCQQPNKAPNSRTCFDENWLFSKTTDTTAFVTNFDDANWTKLDLPHDWSIDCTVSQSNKSGIEGGFFECGTAWYRKHFDAPKEWKSRKIAIRFDGVFMNADVWLNGTLLGHQTYGYGGFSFDLSPFLKFDESNIISVKVDNGNPPASRWYTGSGIYRHTWIENTCKVYIPFGGNYITTNTSLKNETQVRVQTIVKNELVNLQSVKVKWSIKDKQNKVVAKAEKVFEIQGELMVSDSLTLTNASLWSPELPNLFTLETTVLDGHKVLHQSTDRFGIRTIAFDIEQGFLLNNKKVILKGVCIHHDAGSLGAAVPDGVYLRQLKLLKELGCNSIRMSHNPQSPVLLDMCDSLGFLVIDEMFDKWSGRMTGYNTTETFDKEGIPDLKYFIKRDRNHPSVILWTVGNETDEQFGDAKKGIEIYNRLKPIVSELDPSRSVSVAMHPGIMGVGPYTELIKYTDVICYNYRTHDFPEWKKDFPNSTFLASETKVYQEGGVKNSATIDYEPNTWFLMEKYPFIAGQYIWAGIDYLGESMCWPRKGLTNGLLYTNGFFKPYAYFTQSVYSEKPMVHIAVVDDSLAFITDTTKHWQKSWFGPPVVSHWNLNKKAGDSVTILTYSNCEKVELILNNKSIGTKNRSDFTDRVIKWQIPYQSGKIRAVGINENQQVEHQLETSSAPFQLNISSEGEALSTEGTGMVALIVSATDQHQRLCPLSRNKITLSIEGDGQIVGVDNGDLTYHVSYKSNEVELRDGKVLVWVKAKIKDSFTLKAESTGLNQTLLTFHSKEKINE